MAVSQPLTVPGIQVRDLGLRLAQRTIFSGLNFTVDGGSCVALLGASSAGKTSLLRIIAGLTEPTAGTVTDADGLAIAGRIAWMGQKDLLYPWLNVAQNVTLGARLRGEKADERWAAHLLDRVGLSGYAQAMPATLSGGMRQRVALARTLYERRPIVLMDEPFSALDAITRAAIQDLAAELLAQHTVLLITHDPIEACRLGHRLLILGRYPAGLEEAESPAGLPPRAPDDPALQASQGKLMQQLLRMAQ